MGRYWNKVEIVSSETGECLQQMNQNFEGDNLCSVNFSPDGQHIVIASLKTVDVWNAANGEWVLQLDPWMDGVECHRYASFSPDGLRIVVGSVAWGTASAFSMVAVFDALNGKCVLGLEGHGGHNVQMNSASFSPNGNCIVTGATDHTAKIWNAHSGECLLTLEGHHGPLNSASFSADGCCIITCSDDSTAKVWSIESGECILTLEGHIAEVNSASFLHTFTMKE
jgi:WD40 repeat protein